MLSQYRRSVNMSSQVRKGGGGRLVELRERGGREWTMRPLTTRAKNSLRKTFCYRQKLLLAIAIMR